MNRINFGSINNLRNYLEFKIKNIDDLKEEVTDIDFKIDVLKYLLELLKDPSNNSFDISLNLPLFYSPKDVDNAMRLISFIGNIERKGIPDELQYKNLKGSLNVLINKIKEDYNDACNQKSMLQDLIEENKDYRDLFVNILMRIKYQKPISNNQQKLLSSYFDGDQLSERNQVWYFEIIRLYNDKLNNRYLEQASVKYEILELLRFGYEVYDEGIYDYDDSVLKKVKTIENISSYGDINFIKECLNSVVTDEDEYLQILVRLLNNLNKQIYDLSLFIEDKDMYINENDKKIIVHDYQNMVELYVGLRNLYNEQLKKQEDEDAQEQEELENKPEKNFIFTKSPTGRIYLLDDLKNMPKEKLDKIGRLLTNFKQNKLAKKHIKGFDAEYKKFRKLVDFQVRVLVREINENTYCIYGACEKKNQDGVRLYNHLSNRPSPDISNLDMVVNEDKKVYEDVLDYIDENAIILNK